MRIMKRKVLSVIMAILMMSVIITPFTANATRTSIEQVGENVTNVTSDGWEYTIDDTYNGISINKYVGNDTTVTLPVQINGKKVDAYSSMLLSEGNGKNIEKLIIPDTNSPIASDENISYTLAWSESLKEVQIGTLFINKIPSNCFLGCKKLSKVTFSDKFLEQAKATGKTIFRDYCFANCSSLKTFVVPEVIK